MKGLGLHCTIQQGRPRVVSVLVDRPAADQLTGRQDFDHLSDAQEDFGLQLKNLASALESYMPLVGTDAVVVRAMDYAPAIKRQTLQKHSMVIGVLLSIARKYCDATYALSGRDIGVSLGSSKASVEGDAVALVGDGLKEAGAAALAALHLAENA